MRKTSQRVRVLARGSANKGPSRPMAPRPINSQGGSPVMSPNHINLHGSRVLARSPLREAERPYNRVPLPSGTGRPSGTGSPVPCVAYCRVVVCTGVLESIYLSKKTYYGALSTGRTIDGQTSQNPVNYMVL